MPTVSPSLKPPSPSCRAPSQVLRTELMPQASFVFLGERRMFITFQHKAVSVWTFAGDLLTTLEVPPRPQSHPSPPVPFLLMGFSRFPADAQRALPRPMVAYPGNSVGSAR